MATWGELREAGITRSLEALRLYEQLGTYAAVADVLGVTRERVRQLLQRLVRRQIIPVMPLDAKRAARQAEREARLAEPPVDRATLALADLHQLAQTLGYIPNTVTLQHHYPALEMRLRRHFGSLPQLLHAAAEDLGLPLERHPRGQPSHRRWKAAHGEPR